MPIPTTTNSRCGCDACVEVFEPGSAWTPDGYCSFCAAQCYPPMIVGDQFGRMKSSREHRLAAHGIRHASAPKPLADRTLPSAIRDVRAQAAIEAGVALAKTLSPLLPPKWQKVVRAMGRNR